MKPKKPCKHCFDPWPNHWPFQCPKNPKSQVRKPQKPRKPIPQRTPIKKRGKRAIQDSKNRKQWIQDNPPDYRGYWECYLRIHEMCPFLIDESQMVIEHVKPKGSHVDLRDDPSNHRPACTFCNGMKGSRELENIREYKEK